MALQLRTWVGLVCVSVALAACSGNKNKDSDSDDDSSSKASTLESRVVCYQQLLTTIGVAEAGYDAFFCSNGTCVSDSAKYLDQIPSSAYGAWALQADACRGEF